MTAAADGDVVVAGNLASAQRRRRATIELSGRRRAQGLAIGRVYFLGFNFGQLLKSLRQALHPIGMILFDQCFVDLLDGCRLGNSENARIARSCC